MLKALTAIAPVHVAALADNRRDADVADAKIAPMCASVKLVERRKTGVVAGLSALLRGSPVSVEMFYDDALADHVERLLGTGKIGAIVAFSSQMARYVSESWRGPFIMDFVDVDSAKFEQMGAEAPRFSPMGWVQRREGRVLRRWEAAVAGRASHALFVSEAEAALFRARSGLDAGTVMAVANGIDSVQFDPAASLKGTESAANRPLLVFTGQMDYNPNINAVKWFIDKILYKIPVAERPVFAIVGRAPTAEVLALAGPDVIVTGEVDDVRPWLQAADVVVAPLLLARGIQNKVLEAMAMARPVVASAAAAEGIEATDGEHWLTTPTGDASAMATAIGALLKDRERAQHMGNAARALMVAAYSWKARLAPLKRLLSGLERPA